MQPPRLNRFGAGRAGCQGRRAAGGAQRARSELRARSERRTDGYTVAACATAKKKDSATFAAESLILLAPRVRRRSELGTGSVMDLTGCR
jgi:hypothetical protein